MNKICKDCGKCCEETEMLLSPKDIRLIERNVPEIIKEDFVVLKDGSYQMKNENNYCVFFNSNSKLCKIYKFRPQGCRFYPIIYDRENYECIYDCECPRVSSFYLGKKQFRDICNKIKTFIKTI